MKLCTCLIHLLSLRKSESFQFLRIQYSFIVQAADNHLGVIVLISLDKYWPFCFYRPEHPRKNDHQYIHVQTQIHLHILLLVGVYWLVSIWNRWSQSMNLLGLYLQYWIWNILKFLYHSCMKSRSLYWCIFASEFRYKRKNRCKNLLIMKTLEDLLCRARWGCRT